MHKVHPEKSHLVTSLATPRNNSSPESVPIHQTSTEKSNKEQAPHVPPQHIYSLSSAGPFVTQLHVLSFMLTF